MSPNTNPTTGIRYGVIALNSLDPDLAQEIADDLDDYPILDEDHHSELEWGEITQYWAESSVKDRMEFIASSRSDTSIFAARRADFPSDDSGALFDWLRD